MATKLSLYLEEPKSLPDAVATAMRRAMRSGELRPGDRLYEAKIAGEMGISRGPVREAFRILQQQGLIDIEARRGASVRQLTTEDCREIYTLRALLESFAVRLALQNHAYDTEALSLLQHLVDRMSEGSSDDPLGTLEYDLRFHDLMCSRSNHKLLLDVLSNLHARIEQFHIATRFVRRDIPQLALEHQQLLDTIARGDPVAAGEAVRDHINRVGELYLRSLARSEPGRLENRE